MKDAVEKHFKSEPHVPTIKLSKQENLGDESFCEEVVMNLQIAKSFLRLNPADKNSLQVKFNTTYYIIKKERPFTDYPDLLKLQAKNGIENNLRISAQVMTMLMQVLTLEITLEKFCVKA